MAEKFQYRRIREMEPRPGTPYSTRYIQMTPHQHQRCLEWCLIAAQAILGRCERDAAQAEWLTQPHPKFRRSQRGEYYTPEDIIYDVVNQLNSGLDLPEAMVGRWNRLLSSDWHLEFESEQRIGSQDRYRELFA